MATVIAPAVAFGDRTVTARWFGTGNAARTIWNLAGMDSDRALLMPVLYRKDWQASGHYQLYSTARTNLCIRSQELDNATAWPPTAAGTGSAPAVTGNYGVAPDGTTTAERVVMALNGGTGSGDQSNILQNIGGLTVSTVYTFSAWVKTTDSSTKNITILSSGVQSSLKQVTGTWTRISASTAASGVSANFGFRLRGNAGTSDGADLLVWGCQVEAASAPTSYIATTSAAVAVTDYSVDAAGKVTFAAAPVLAADVAYKDPWFGTNVFKSFGTGNAASTQFSLPWAPATPSIYVDGVLQTLTTNYTVTPGGAVTFVVAPGSGAVLTWTGSFGAQR